MSPMSCRRHDVHRHSLARDLLRKADHRLSAVIRMTSAYQPGIDAYGRQFGVYLGEPMRAVDWQAIREL